MRIIIHGFRDGLTQPWQFNVGRTYDSAARQYLYDTASIWGQRVARIRDVWQTPEM